MQSRFTRGRVAQFETVTRRHAFIRGHFAVVDYGYKFSRE